MATTETAAKAATRAPRAAAKVESEALEAQVARLQDDLKAITATLGRLGADKVSEARSVAETEYRHAVKAGQDLVGDVTGQAGALEKQLKDVIRQRPLAAVVGALGVGFLIAALTR